MAYRERRKMGCTVLIYVIILVVDLIVGSSLIVWKCSFRQVEDECKLAMGGTLGSVIIWLFFMLICPCFMTRCEFGIAWDNVKKKCIKYMEKIRPRKPREIYVQNEIYRPTTTSWLDIGQGQYVTCNDFDGPRTDVNTKLLTSRNGPLNLPQEKIYVFSEKECSKHQGLLIKYLDHDDP